MRILAVDDEPSILELLTQILAVFGYEEVVTAPNGRDALEILRSDPKPFDCLLLDVQMPQMNGIDLCEAVRSLPGYRFTPIIMVTAMVQKQYIDDAFEVGASDYVTKPFEFEDLKQRLSDAYRLAAERKAAILAMEAFDNAQTDSKVAHEFQLGDPLVLNTLAGCQGLAEFENYVGKIATSHPLDASVLAVKVEDADWVYRNSTSDVFRSVMSAAGREILSATQGARSLATYWGNGVFLVVLDNNCPVDIQGLANRMAEIATTSDSENLSIGNISCRLGEVVPLRATTKLEALFLIDKAVETAEVPFSPMTMAG
ncbi:response regulator [Ruegeria marina]|uniref:Response regulator receiver domain-containing protein n=1 Tax=Ruegeria marina TaxID=639004 RepID=A0A1G7E2E6_9RHOB|nr:response regulator [Ruegeria marina]SDE57666.1 Response regulator receiver domain-containing protein [Ruegeria marina]